MTITLSPDQEKAVRDAIRTGRIASVEEFIQQAIASLPGSNKTQPMSSPTTSSVFEQGLGLFGSPEDASLLDEVVSIAYEERRRPSKQEPSL